MNINKRDFILFSNSIEEIDFNLVKKNLKLNSVVVLRGLVQKEEIYKAVKKLNMNFDRNNDNPTIGESPKDIQRNFQKLLVGGHTHSGLYLTRFFRTFYNPLWEEDIYLMHNIFKLMIKIRNRCINYPEDFAMERIEKNGLWSATRIHQYPTGGGYFAKHRDSVLTEVSKEKDLDFIQVIINMTKYGVDFQCGGAFVEINGEKIIFEKEFDIGDIIIYDERTTHGVDEIDANKRLDLDNICGRLTAFVSLYKNLKK